MMGLDCDSASIWKYQAVLWHWNDRHATEEGEPVEAPNEDFVKYRAMKLAQLGIATGSIN